MKYFIVAGERSGDLHGSNLVKELSKIDSNSQFVGFGGDKMASVGVEIKLHYREMAFMGFLEVIQNLFKIKGFINQCKREIETHRPDAVILIDYGGFNMKIAKFCTELGIPVHYYISPKVWAWNQKRALKLKRYVDHMYVILPFEKDFFQKFDWEVEYVGNPVLDAIKKHTISDTIELKNYIALLPGSRKQELKHMLPLFRKLVESMPDSNFVVAAVDNLDDELYDEINESSNVQLFKGSSYDLLHGAKAAVVTSGTATLETALWGIPQVVVYKTSTISYKIAKAFIKVPFISLVNLIANKEVVKELIQSDLNINNLTFEVDRLLNDRVYHETILKEYQLLKETLNVGSASKNVAKLMFNHLLNNN